MYTSVADSKATFKAEHPEMTPFLDDICLEKATNAFNNSYSRPDLVGLNTQMEYAQRLVSEVTSVREAVNSAIDRGATVIGDWEAEIDLWFAGFREGLKQKFYDYLSAESRCASSFICGPANFPTARNQKSQATARVRREEISEYCNKAVKGILATILPHGDGVAIRSDDPDAITKLQAKIVNLEERREYMKNANRIVRNFFPKGTVLCDVSAEQQQQCIDMLVAETSCSPEAAATLIEPDYAERVKPFASYTLSQTGTQIRECHARIDALKKLERMSGDDLLCHTFDNGINVSVSDDKRLVINFGYKPDDATRKLLNKNGFRWSPRREGKPWVRKLTTSTVFAYAQFVKPKIESLPIYEG